MDVQRLVYAIVKFLKAQKEEGGLSVEATEGVEVVIQCLEAAYKTSESDDSLDVPSSLLEIFQNYLAEHPEAQSSVVTPEEKVEAEKHKTEGNSYMNTQKFSEALVCYTKAIQLDPKNSVYYCNRAAASNKLGNYQSAVQDCKTALKIDPNYSKAYGRLGLAYSSMEKHREAVESYQKAVALEPENESYKSNLRLAEEAVTMSPPLNQVPSNVDLGMIFTNPTLINMATQMLSNPQMQNIMSNIIGNVNTEGGQGVDVLLQAGQQLFSQFELEQNGSQQLAQQMEQDNPGLVDQLRRHMGEQPPPPNPPPNPPQ